MPRKKGTAAAAECEKPTRRSHRASRAKKQPEYEEEDVPRKSRGAQLENVTEESDDSSEGAQPINKRRRKGKTGGSPEKTSGRKIRLKRADVSQVTKDDEPPPRRSRRTRRGHKDTVSEQKAAAEHDEDAESPADESQKKMSTRAVNMSPIATKLSRTPSGHWLVCPSTTEPEDDEDEPSSKPSPGPSPSTTSLEKAESEAKNEPPTLQKEDVVEQQQENSHLPPPILQSRVSKAKPSRSSSSSSSSASSSSDESDSRSVDSEPQKVSPVQPVSAQEQDVTKEEKTILKQTESNQEANSEKQQAEKSKKSVDSEPQKVSPVQPVSAQEQDVTTEEKTILKQTESNQEANSEKQQAEKSKRSVDSEPQKVSPVQPVSAQEQDVTTEEKTILKQTESNQEANSEKQQAEKSKKSVDSEPQKVSPVQPVSAPEQTLRQDVTKEDKTILKQTEEANSEKQQAEKSNSGLDIESTSLESLKQCSQIEGETKIEKVESVNAPLVVESVTEVDKTQENLIILVENEPPMENQTQCQVEKKNLETQKKSEPDVVDTEEDIKTPDCNLSEVQAQLEMKKSASIEHTKAIKEIATVKEAITKSCDLLKKLEPVEEMEPKKELLTKEVKDEVDMLVIDKSEEEEDSENEITLGNRQSEEMRRIQAWSTGDGRKSRDFKAEKEKEKKNVAIPVPRQKRPLHERVSLKRNRIDSECKQDAVTPDECGKVLDTAAASHTKKRRWGSSQVTVQNVAISTDVLKNIIPDVQPAPEDEVKSLLEDDPGKQTNKESRGAEALDKLRDVSETHPPASVEAAPMFPAAPLSPQPQIEVEPKRGRTVRKISIMQDDTLQKSPSPPRHIPTSILHITNLVRPFTLPQLKELLCRTGSIIDDTFSIDKIKSRCLVQFTSEEEARATRHALHGVRWPLSNPKRLNVDFASQETLQKFSTEPESVTLSVRLGTQQRIVSTNGTAAADDSQGGTLKTGVSRDVEYEERGTRLVKMNAPVREWDLHKINQSEEERRPHLSGHHNDNVERVARAVSLSPGLKIKKKGEDGAAKLLDDLFQKTKAAPCIYWLPLSPQQIAEKEEMRRMHMAEHERRISEMQRADEHRVMRPYNSSRRGGRDNKSPLRNRAGGRSIEARRSSSSTWRKAAAPSAKRSSRSISPKK